MAKLFGGSNIPFANRKQLAADHSRFCILDANTKVSNGREQWFLDISRKADDDVILETLTFDRSAYRDKGFGGLNYPQHNCWLDKRLIKGKLGTVDFYDLQIEDTPLPCACADGGTSSGETSTPPPDDEYVPEDPGLDIPYGDEFP